MKTEPLSDDVRVTIRQRSDCQTVKLQHFVHNKWVTKADRDFPLDIRSQPVAEMTRKAKLIGIL